MPYVCHPLVILIEILRTNNKINTLIFSLSNFFFLNSILDHESSIELKLYNLSLFACCIVISNMRNAERKSMFIYE